MTSVMNAPIFLAHGALGSWDEIGLALFGVLMLGYLVILALQQRRHKQKQEQDLVNGAKDELTTRLD